MLSSISFSKDRIAGIARVVPGTLVLDILVGILGESLLSTHLLLFKPTSQTGTSRLHYISHLKQLL